MIGWHTESHMSLTESHSPAAVRIPRFCRARAPTLEPPLAPTPFANERDLMHLVQISRVVGCKPS